MTTLTPDQRLTLKLAVASKTQDRFVRGRHCPALETLGFLEVAMDTPRGPLYQVTPAGEAYAKEHFKRGAKKAA